MATTSPSENDQGDLLDDEPKANSQADLGYQKPYGQGTPSSRGAEDRVNLASGTIGRKEALVFIEWLKTQEFEVHVDVTLGHVLTDLSGKRPEDLRWLCQAILQAKKAPEPWRMSKALKARDVGILRGVDPEPRERLARF